MASPSNGYFAETYSLRRGLCQRNDDEKNEVRGDQSGSFFSGKGWKCNHGPMIQIPSLLAFAVTR